MSDLVEFLRARLDEDEHLAKSCAGAPWAAAVTGMIHVDPQAIRDAKWKWGNLGYVATVEHVEDREHIARHDPARVLREVEAKRWIVGQHAELSDDDGDTGLCGECYEGFPCEHLRRLAHPYSDHADYREDWRP